MKMRLTLNAFTNRLHKQIATLTLLPLLVAGCALPAIAQSSSVELKWLGDTPPAVPMGVSWGVPWPQGKVRKDQAFTLTTASGMSLPLQSWPLAWWPDGSIKWAGFATVAGPEATGSLALSLSDTAAPTSGPALQVRQSDTTFEIDTGRLKVRISRWGATLIDSMTIDGREVARDGRLICILQDGPDGDAENAAPREKYSTKVEKVSQDGPGRRPTATAGLRAAILAGGPSLRRMGTRRPLDYGETRD
jgi:hypothetical protein